MGPWYYEVVSFDGDYVNLRRTDIESDELNPVALALLPPEIEVGSKIKCEYFQYEIIGCSRRPFSMYQASPERDRTIPYRRRAGRH